MIKDLVLETHHRGTYLLVRALTPSERMTGARCLLEDEEGDGIFVRLYNQEEESERGVADIVKENDIMIIKEPYLFFKYGTTGGGELRVDHLCDLVRLQPDNAQIPLPWRATFTKASASEWKAKGNVLFKTGEYHAASEW